MTTYEYLICELKRQMRVKSTTQTDVAQKLNITQVIVNRRLNHGTLKVTHHIAICDMVGLEIEIREK